MPVHYFIWSVSFWDIDPCARYVQYLELFNTLIFPEMFSTGDFLTLVDHTLIDHTACTSTAIMFKWQVKDVEMQSNANMRSEV